VDANGNPANFPLNINDNGDGTYDVQYQAANPGDYKLTVLLGDQPIKDMPTNLKVHAGVDAANTTVTGPGVEGGMVNKDLPFLIQAKDKSGKPLAVGGDDFKVTVQGPNGPVPCDVKDNGDGTYTGSYKPTAPGDYVVDLRVNDQDTPVGNAPYTAKVKFGGNCQKSYAKGKGWRYAYDNVPATFKVYVKDENNNPVAGEDVKVVLVDKSSQAYKDSVLSLISQVDEYMLKKKADQNAAAKAARAAAGEKVEPDEGDVPVTVVDNGNGSYTVTYVAGTPGEYECSVEIGAGHIKNSPKTIPVHWSCPNKPCAHTQKCLHSEIRAQRDEIYALKKELAALKGEAFEPDAAQEEEEEEDE
jgi:filamin